MKSMDKNELKPWMKSRKKVIEKLDIAFSQYIRLKDADMGEATCVTCGVTKHWKEMQAGHYESRGHYATRWDVQNVHVQCVGCNVFKKGNYTQYARYMVRRYGDDILDEMYTRSRETVKVPTTDLIKLVLMYRQMVKDLTKNS